MWGLGSLRWSKLPVGCPAVSVEKGLVWKLGNVDEELGSVNGGNVGVVSPPVYVDRGLGVWELGGGEATVSAERG